MAKTKIGGQAVMEGVMMRGETSMALAVRDEAGVVRVESKRIPPKKAINKILDTEIGSVNSKIVQ